MSSHPDTRPFGRIALALSGAGSRAAAWHLGTLGYLSRLDLLDDVNVVAGVSGGSLVAASYALSLKLSPPFEPIAASFARYYRELYGFLLAAPVVPSAVRALASDAVHAPSGRHTLALALAEIYDRGILKQQRFAAFSGPRPIPVESLVLGATDLATGGAFRFAAGAAATEMAHEAGILPSALAERLRVADIVAACAATPTSLEPMMYPGDFVPPNASDPADVRWHALAVEPRQLADGALADVLGVDALLAGLAAPTAARVGRHDDAPADLTGTRRAARWLDRHERAGLFIVSNAPLPRAAAPPATSVVRGPTFGAVSAAGWAALGLAALAGIGALGHAVFTWSTRGPVTPLSALWVDIALVVVAGTLAAVLAWGRRTGRAIRRALHATRDVRWADLRRMRVGDALQMATLRSESARAADAVHHASRRELQFARIDAVPPLREKLLSQDVQELTTPEASGLPEWLRPSHAIVTVAQAALDGASLPWVEGEHDLHAAIAAGQLTMCYRMLQYLARDAGNASPEAVARRRAMFDRARTDWEILKANPHAFVRPPDVA